MANKELRYMQNDEFWEITFDIPKGKLSPQELANLVAKHFPTAHNIQSVPCKIRLEPPKLVVDRDNYGLSVYSSKEKGRFLE